MAARDVHGIATAITEHVEELQSGAIALRRKLHEWPETGNVLPRTRETVLESLADLPLDITLHETTSGIGALLTGGKPGPTVMLRGDMDALPMPEDTGLDFASRVDNVMHACGHDTHTSMLATAARLLSERRADLPGRVLFMFQPGEEGHHGAKFMLDEGLLDVPALADGTPSPVSAAYAIHITTNLPCGWVSSKGGPIMASSDTFEIVVTGKGGHASEPFRARDPIPVACEIVQALQMHITRRINVFDPSVVTVTQIHTGTTSNVIPETARINGTIRAVSESTRKKVHDGLKRVAVGIAETHDMSADVNVTFGYPVTVNDTPSADFGMSVADALVGADKAVRLPHPIMGAEDFSYVLNKLPGAMMFLGGTPEGVNPASAAPNHSNRVMFDEDAMKTGVALYASLAMRSLGVRLD
ncbi:MAG: amidohydrolase [Actinobacteria bacterium]|nr:amidohydrolase [Actinomycetota bacterium]NCY08954.1 amidohydrolase [Actinomycetota bacterium]NDG76278.1 amidohydrolase [Acidimicrobiia bacterium]